MSQVTTEVEICNLALDRIGQAPIASITSPVSVNENICARHYHQTRRELLREYIFNFARKVATLTTDAAAPTHPDFTNGYALPNDFIRLMTIGDNVIYGGNTPTNFFDLIQGFIYCDEQSSTTAGGLDVKYVYDAITVAKFDSLFVKVLKLQLASNMAYKFTLSKSLKESLDKELEDAHLKAAAIAGQEKPPQRIQRSRIRDVRRSGGIFRNNTIITGP